VKATTAAHAEVNATVRRREVLTVVLPGVMLATFGAGREVIERNGWERSHMPPIVPVQRFRVNRGSLIN
jgi:hypothetical protein